MYFLSHRNDIIVVFTVYILRYMWVPLKGPGPVLDLDGKGMHKTVFQYSIPEHHVIVVGWHGL